eukprot:CAMPEP_0119567960 /NCGR_PEP_ID=MMETSP1352-20130426/37499_1 /TAXON_ID=265584 /ORGANISM="Stauroneis constricta, Strain CCMP1120" /LENGTH=44 /DNA_ID= /DNA_START= /DNA_END= /DNA_ORIENTATION=
MAMAFGGSLTTIDELFAIADELRKQYDFDYNKRGTLVLDLRDLG